MADFQQNFLASLHGGMDFGQRIKQQRDTSQLNQLASLAYSAPADQRESILSQTAAVDAGAAQGLEKQMAYSDERRNTNMMNMARTLTNAPEQARAGLYRSMVPTLSRFGLSEMPQEYTPETAPIIMQAAKSLVDASMGAAGTPTDVRSFQMMTQGLSTDDQMKARRINLGLDGRASNAGYGFFEFEGADGHKRMGRNNPRTGAREMYDEASGDFVPLGGMSGGAGDSSAPAPQAPGQQSFGDFTSLAGEFPGITMTSGMRTAERNQQVGGAGNSQHLTGTAADYAVPPQLKPAFISRAKQLGYQAIDEGDHIHLQLPRGARAGANLTVGRRPEDEAAATERAKLQAQRDFLPTKLRMEEDSAIRQAEGIQTAKDRAERAGQAPKRIKQYQQALTASQNVKVALKEAVDLVGGTTTGWTGARMRNIEGSGAYDLASKIETVKANLGFDRLQEMRDNSPTGGALGAIAVQELVALQSTIANLDPNQSAEQLKASLQQVEKHYQNWEEIVRMSLADEQRGGSATAQPPAGQAAPAASDFSNLWN